VCDAGAGCAVGGALVFLGARVLVLSSVAASVLFLPLVPSGLPVAGWYGSACEWEAAWDGTRCAAWASGASNPTQAAIALWG